MSFRISLSAILASLIVLTGCSKRYQIQRLEHLSPETADIVQTQDQVTVMVKKWDNSPKYREFFAQDRPLPKYIQPIQLTIINGSASRIIFNQNSFNIQDALLTPQQVINTLRQPAVGISVLATSGSFFFAPLWIVPSIMITAYLLPVPWSMYALCAPIFTGIGILAYITHIQDIIEHNNMIRERSILLATFDNQVIIPGCSTESFLVFFDKSKLNKELLIDLKYSNGMSNIFNFFYTRA